MPTRVLSFRARLAAILPFCVVWACSLDEPSAPAVDGAAFAKGGGGPPPKVQQVIPDFGEQGTALLTVQVIGSGYAEGSGVAFTIDGNPVPQMVILETRFVDESTLEADVQIDETAPLTLYDVEVTVPGRGKKATGADLFQVVEKGTGKPQPAPDDAQTISTFNDAVVDCAICSDGNGSYAAATDVRSHFEFAATDPLRTWRHTTEASISCIGTQSCVADVGGIRAMALHFEYADGSGNVWASGTMPTQVAVRNPRLVGTTQAIDVTAMAPGTIAVALLRVFLAETATWVVSVAHCTADWVDSHRVLVIANGNGTWTVRPRETGDELTWPELASLGPPQPMRGCTPDDTKNRNRKPGRPPSGVAVLVPFELTITLQ